MKIDGRASFSIWFLICQLLGLISIGMLASWLVKYNGGFAWESNAKLEFSWHPLLMVIGLVFLNGNGKYFMLSFLYEDLSCEGSSSLLIKIFNQLWSKFLNR